MRPGQCGPSALRLPGHEIPMTRSCGQAAVSAGASERSAFFSIPDLRYWRAGAEAVARLAYANEIHARLQCITGVLRRGRGRFIIVRLIGACPSFLCLSG